MIQHQDKVICPLYPEKGMGTVLSVQETFGESIYQVLFEKTGEVLRIQKKELRAIETPIQKIQKGITYPPEHYILRWQKAFIQAEKSTKELRTIGNFKIKPLPHQILVVDFILNQFKPRAFIADEVGLGKTIEAALIMEELKARSLAHRILVIAPSGLCRQWKDEMKQKFFEDFIIYNRSTVNALMGIHGKESNTWKLNDQIIASIDFVKPKSIIDEDESLSPREKRFREFHNQHILKAIEEADFDLVIIDEAHKLSKDTNKKSTARYKIGKSLSEVSPFFLLLSATPHQGKSERFKNLLHLIDPYQFYQGCQLDPIKVKSITARNNKRAVRDFEGKRLFTHRLTSVKRIDRALGEDRLELNLYHAVSDYIREYYNYAFQEKNFLMMFLLLLYQRMVSSSSRAILKSLQKRRAKLVECRKQLLEEEKRAAMKEEVSVEEMEELNGEESLKVLEQYDVLSNLTLNKKDFDVEIGILDHCIQLAISAITGRQDAKMRELVYLLDEFKRKENQPSLKFIIFTEFVETQKYIDEILQQYGYTTALINGSMSLDVKIEQRERFEKEAQILISTDAGGEGVNLQFCYVMIQYDLPWNPMRLEQRIGRIDRIGQQHDVKVVNFQLADTVEQRVRDKIETKLDLIRKEFNQDENKLADIVSTLDEEFDFEKIYSEALQKRESETESLDAIAEKIYQRAKEIISTDEFLLPYNEWTNPLPITLQEIEKRKYQVMDFTKLLLHTRETELNEYKEQADLFYFTDPLQEESKKMKVFFDPNLSAKYDTAELLSFEHPYIQKIFQYIDNQFFEETTSAFQIRNNTFAGKKGLLFLYILKVDNYIDPQKVFFVPCFIEDNFECNRRISRFCKELFIHEFKPISTLPAIQNVSLYEQQANVASDEFCSVQFSQQKEEWSKKIDAEKEKLNQYFQDKYFAIDQIGIENIKGAKLKQLEQEKASLLQNFQKRLLLTPQKDFIGVAYVEFVE